MERRKQERVSVFVSPEAKAMLREMAERWFPGLHRPLGAAVDRVIRAEYQRMQDHSRWNNESFSPAALRGIGATGSPAPTDEEVAQILGDERMKKYGQQKAEEARDE